MAARILVAEDDVRIASFLVRGLAAEGYDVEQTHDGRSTLAAATSGEYALIILDRMMPGMDGLDVCRRLREQGRHTRVLMLTAKDRLQDKVDGFKGGADDYVTKPFAVDELLARIEALLRRPDAAPLEGILQVGDLRLDLDGKAAWRGERRLTLTPREFALLACLMEHADTVVSRERLLSYVWGRNFDPGNKVVDVYIRYLRRKVDEGEDKPLIRTVRGFGFMVSRKKGTFLIS
ncbi:MAG TPA: response regulator transcription factor [Steroidobacteraceae bacterium]